MKKFLVFLGGFVAGILATVLVAYIITKINEPADGGLPGLTLFEEKGDCLTTTSKSKSCELEIFQVLEPHVALANINYYTDKKSYDDSTYRSYDTENEVLVLLINYENKSYYDKQKIDLTNKCVRQIGTYQYTTQIEFQKTVPAVVIE